jgi:threonine/homoserine/homoserine lactone efflux protein
MANGPRALLQTVSAVFFGYAFVVIALVLWLGEWLIAHESISKALRLTCAIYLVKLSLDIWKDSEKMQLQNADDGASIQPFRKVFAVTLMNPKGLIGGLVLIPGFLQQKPPVFAAWQAISVFLAMAAVITAVYTLVGAMASSKAGPNRLSIAISKLSALTIFGFACVMVAK